MKSAIIVVDIGNTRTSFALARNGHISHVAHLPTHRLDKNAVRQKLSKLVRSHDITGSALCSVVPDQNRFWQRELTRATGRAPLQVHYRLRMGIHIDYPRPATIGADRLANACAAAERYGTPVIVADFGTALTFDIVSKEKAYVGGVIAPGLLLMTDYLADRTALLPRLRLKPFIAEGKNLNALGAIGKSTVQAMVIGARLGYRGMVREILAHLRKALKDRRVRVCATGGYASWALAGSDLPVFIDPDLTLYGISRIYEWNRPEDYLGHREHRE